MDPNAVVFDISSDEDVGWGEGRALSGGSDDFGWISDLLEEVDREKDDSDDVVLVGEIVVNPKAAKKDVLDADDDCVILDGDPDKLVEIADSSVCESDDLLVVGEKGQVACRDYPHARHLCAKFPFASTSHESHCDLCHCYVCDSLAPCAHWGTGVVSSNHCHATDKDQFWRNLRRKCLKPTNEATLQVLSAPETPISSRPLQINQVPPSTPLQPNYAPQAQVFRPASASGSSVPTTIGNPNVVTPSRNQRPAYVVPKNKFQSHLVSRQLLSSCNSILPRDRRHKVGSMSPHNISPHPPFKRIGTPGVSIAPVRSRYSSSNRGYYPRGRHHYAIPSDRNPNCWQEFCGGTSPESNTHPITSQNTGNSFASPLPAHPHVSSQPNVGSVFVNPVPSQPQLSSQPNAVRFSLNSTLQPQVPPEPYWGSAFENPVPSQAQVTSQPIASSSFTNSGTPQVCSQPLPVLQDCQNIFYQGKEPSQVCSQPLPVSQDCRSIFYQGKDPPQNVMNVLGKSFTDFDFSWDNPNSQSNQLLTESSQLQGTTATDKLVPVMEFDQQFAGSPNPDALDFQFDSWILENQPASGAQGVPPGLNVLSPEPVPIDAGILFDV